MSFSNYDVVFGIIILLSALIALVRGAVAEVLAIISWLLAIWTFQHFAPLFKHPLSKYISNETLCSIAAFVLILILFAILTALFKKVFGKVISSIGLGGINHLLGFGFGILRGILICAVLVIAIELIGFDHTHSWEKAKSSKFIIPVVVYIQHAISIK